MCNFCKHFDWGAASYEVDKYGVRIVSAGGNYKFPEERQFMFCPVCGERRIKEKVKSE